MCILEMIKGIKKKGKSRLWYINGDVHSPLEDGVGTSSFDIVISWWIRLEFVLFIDYRNGREEIELLSIRNKFIKNIFVDILI